MFSRLRCLLLLPLAALVACGSSSPIPGATGSIAPGDYVITVAASTANASFFTGALTVAGTSVSGVFRYTNPGTLCVSTTQDISFTGTIGNGILTLTSGAFSGSTAAFTIQLPAVQNNLGQEIANGTAVIAGGTCALASTTLQALLIPSYSANWKVTLTNPTAATATLAVTESSANADGQFPASATLTCSTGPPISLNGLVSGPTLQLANTPASTVTVSANSTVAPVTITINGGCSGTGTMSQ